MSKKHSDVVVNLARLAEDYQGAARELLDDAIDEIERLRADQRRLDWLLDTAPDMGGWAFYDADREAIDAAMLPRED